MPFFGFSRTSSSRHKNKKKTSVDVTAARSSAVQQQQKEPIRRTSSCTVSRLHVEKFDHSVVGLTSEKLVDSSLEEPHIKIQTPSPGIEKATTIDATLIKFDLEKSLKNSKLPKQADNKANNTNKSDVVYAKQVAASTSKQDEVSVPSVIAEDENAACGSSEDASDKSGYGSDSDKMPDVILRRKITTQETSSIILNNKKSPRSRRRSRKDSIMVKLNRRSQHFEDNPIDVSKNRKSRNFEEDIQQCQKDPLKRFEYLRNGKATSVMIRATPNAVRWDEINRIQYRFQALNFHSDVLDALIQNSPPLSRREHNAASKEAEKNDKNNNNIRRRDGNNNNNGSLSSDDDEDETDNNDREGDTTTAKNFERSKKSSQGSRVRTIRRMNSSEVRRADYERKGSVVQVVGPKDDTSDYNSDEEVFQTRSEGDFHSVNYNTTICHVKTGHIADTTQIHVTSYDSDNNNNNNKKTSTTTQIPSLPSPSTQQVFTRQDLNVLADPYTYQTQQQRQASSAPPSTKVSTVLTPGDDIIAPSNKDKFHSQLENLNNAASTSNNQEDLSIKSKEDLIELVKSLQKELESTKQQSSQQQQQQRPRTRTPSPSADRHTQHRHHMYCASRHDSISEEIDTEQKEERQQPPWNVSSLIENFEKQQEHRLKRSSTLPYRIRKPPI